MEVLFHSGISDCNYTHYTIYITLARSSSEYSFNLSSSFFYSANRSFTFSILSLAYSSADGNVFFQACLTMFNALTAVVTSFSALAPFLNFLAPSDILTLADIAFSYAVSLMVMKTSLMVLLRISLSEVLSSVSLVSSLTSSGLSFSLSFSVQKD